MEKMVGSETLSQILNPLVLNLQNMELKLKCPKCLKLFDEPITMPCNHTFCRQCIPTSGENGANCPSCDMLYVNKDLRPVRRTESLIYMHQTMTNMAANFAQQQSHGINDVNETTQEAVIHNMSAKANTSNPHEDEDVELATHGRKKPTHDTSEEGEPCSPPSFTDIRDSDHDDSDGGSEFRIERRFPTVDSSSKDLNDGMNHITEPDIRQTMRPKLNSRLDVGSTKGPFMPRSDSEYNHNSSREVQPLRASNYLDGSRIIECAFCSSFRTTEGSGQMLHYLNGEPVGMDQAAHPDVLHVHEKCIEWAPQVYFLGDTVKNLEAELSRASKIKCSSCGLKGAALGCYAASCRKSFHVPCAYEILECRWDCENFHVLCPAHSSHRLPCDRSKRKRDMTHHPPESTSQSGDRILSATENYEQTRVASPDAGRELVVCVENYEQTRVASPDAGRDLVLCVENYDQTRVASPDAGRDLVLSAENYDQTRVASPDAGRDLVLCVENYDQTWVASPYAGRGFLLCGSALSKEEKDILKKFAGMSGAVVTYSWNPNVTHIISSTNDDGACPRSFKFLMAILSGKWVLSMQWVKACMKAGHLVEAEPYEISLDIHGSTDGPKNGRIRALTKAPKLYAKQRFYFSGYFAPDYKCYLQKLILAAGGTIMEEDDLIRISRKEASVNAFVVYNLEPPEDCNAEDSDEVLKNRSRKAEAFAAKTGSRAIAHSWLLETIANCNLNH